MNVLDTLLQRNRLFAAGPFQPDLPLMPTLRALVIGCADPRVDPAHVLGLHPGEAVVIRNVGGRVTPATLETLALLQQVGRAEGTAPAGRFDLIVLQHTDCGITRLAGQPESLAHYFGVGVAELPGKAVGDPRAAVAADVAALRARPWPPGWVVSGMVYDVHSGRVETVVGSDPRDEAQIVPTGDSR